MNTGLAVGTSPGNGFENWRAYVAAHPDLAVGALLRRSVPTLSDAEAAAYDAPFPDVSYKAGVRAFPQLVMTEPDEVCAQRLDQPHLFTNQGFRHRRRATSMPSSRPMPPAISTEVSGRSRTRSLTFSRTRSGQ